MHTNNKHKLDKGRCLLLMEKQESFFSDCLDFFSLLPEKQ